MSVSRPPFVSVTHFTQSDYRRTLNDCRQPEARIGNHWRLV